MVLRRHAFSTEFLFIFYRNFSPKGLENSLPKMPIGTTRFFAFFWRKKLEDLPAQQLGQPASFCWKNFGENLAAFRPKFLALSVCQCVSGVSGVSGVSRSRPRPQPCKHALLITSQRHRPMRRLRRLPLFCRGTQRCRYLVRVLGSYQARVL